MIHLINSSSAYYGSGLSMQRKLMKIQSGVYAGRMAAIIPISASEIALTYADPPYNSWISPTTVINNSADYPAGCMMDDSGNIYVVYTIESSLNLGIKKLTFNNGHWEVGSVNTIYDADSNYYPSLFMDYSSRMWVCWTRYSGGNYYINIKTSVDDGVNWGIGVGNSGTTLTSGANSAYSQFVYLPTYLYCFYTEGGSKLAFRRYEINGAIWYSESSIYTGSGLLDNFSTAISDDLKIGLSFMAGTDLIFKDYDGVSWSGNYNLDNNLSIAPVIKYNSSIPFVFYGKELGSANDQLYYSFKDGAGFSSPTRITPALSTFDKTLCYYDDGTVGFYDVTNKAKDTTSADIYHIESNGLLKNSGDILYLGMTDKFFHVNLTLSTAGTSGVVSWYYWNGDNWTSFVPSSGAYNFDSSPALIRLWEDSGEAPSTWQSSIVNGSSLFWIKAVVTSAFSTAPVGTQITAGDNIPYITILQEG